MNILLIIGRIAFVLVFILSGAQKLMDISGTAAMIEPKVPIPEAIASYAAQIETAFIDPDNPRQDARTNPSTGSSAISAYRCSRFGIAPTPR